MEENQLKQQVSPILIYFLGTLMLVVDFSLKAVGIYYIFYRLDPVNGAIIMASGSLMTMAIVIANALPKMTKEPRIYIQLPEKIMVEKKEEKL